MKRLTPPMNYVVKALARLDLKKHWRHTASDNLQAADRLLDVKLDPDPLFRHG